MVKKITCMDSIVQDKNNTIHIWYRERKNTKFIYKGQVLDYDVIKERTKTNMLKLKFRLNINSDTYNYCPIIRIAQNFIYWP